ncbi:MAG: carboxymuconolactone decarboxylase family protein [Microthrixaceae bacterium]
MNTEDRRQRGKAMMKQVYGWDIDQVEGSFVESTVDHLFGEVWASGSMSVRERRLLLLGLLVGRDMDDVVGLQLDAAVRLDEFSEDELREMVMFLAHYAGWPSGAKFNQHVETLVARKKKDA